MLKVGDKVVCVDDTEQVIDPSRWVENVMENKIYTIRGIQEADPSEGGVALYFEEIINPINPWVNLEYGYDIKRFRKLEPPKEEITELENELVAQT